MSNRNMEVLTRAKIYKLISLVFSDPTVLKNHVAEFESLPYDVKELRELIIKSDNAELESDFGRLFGHTVNSPFPLYETMYGKENVFQQSSELADIAGFYNASGLKVSDGTERIDHLSTESEFMSYLCFKEAMIEPEESEKKSIVVELQKKFLKDHLGRWALLLADSLITKSHSIFYKKSAMLLQSFLNNEIAVLNIVPNRYREIDMKQHDKFPITSCFDCPSSSGFSYETEADLEEEIR